MSKCLFGSNRETTEQNINNTKLQIDKSVRLLGLLTGSWARVYFSVQGQLKSSYITEKHIQDWVMIHGSYNLRALFKAPRQPDILESLLQAAHLVRQSYPQAVHYCFYNLGEEPCRSWNCQLSGAYKVVYFLSLIALPSPPEENMSIRKKWLHKTHWTIKIYFHLDVIVLDILKYQCLGYLMML